MESGGERRRVVESGEDGGEWRGGYHICLIHHLYRWLYGSFRDEELILLSIKIFKSSNNLLLVLSFHSSSSFDSTFFGTKCVSKII